MWPRMVSWILHATLQFRPGYIASYPRIVDNLLKVVCQQFPLLYFWLFRWVITLRVNYYIEINTRNNYFFSFKQMFLPHDINSWFLNSFMSTQCKWRYIPWIKIKVALRMEAVISVCSVGPKGLCCLIGETDECTDSFNNWGLRGLGSSAISWQGDCPDVFRYKWKADHLFVVCFESIFIMKILQWLYTLKHNRVQTWCIYDGKYDKVFFHDMFLQ